MTSSKLRIRAVDVTVIEHPVAFNGKQYTLNLIATCYGDFLIQAMHATKLLIDTEDAAVASNHFSAVTKRCTHLRHRDKKLEDHIEDLSDFNYMHGKASFLTLAGVMQLAQTSQNTQARKNKEKFMQLLEAAYTELQATTRVDTQASKMFSSKKKEQQVPSAKEPAAKPAADLDDHACTEDASTALVSFWPNKRLCSTEEFENEVECFFSRPEIVRVKARMEVLEDAWVQESLLDMENLVADQKPVIGYVYVLRNPLFVDLLKIGATFRSSAIRARELSGTGMPEPFEVVAELMCRNPFGMEREIHDHFAEVRKYGKKKEFFTLTPDEINDYFQTLRDKAMRVPSEVDAAEIKKRLDRMRPLNTSAESQPPPKNTKQPKTAVKAEEELAAKMQKPTHPVIQQASEFTAAAADSSLIDTMNFMTTFSDKPAALKEMLAMLLENKKQLLELDYKAIDVKKQMLELERQELDLKATHEERMLQIKVAGRKRMLDLDRKEIEF